MGRNDIKWKRDGEGGFIYEEPDLVLKIRYCLSADPLVRYRCEAIDPTHAIFRPIFRVSAENARMGKRALQAWLDQHRPYLRGT